MSYSAAVDHLYALGHELAPASSDAPRRKFDLAHMQVIAAALGNPQTAFPAILIAGTNGKGSTAATLASILTAAGYRTGLYTSPHLSRINERIQINGIQIPDEDFARLYFRVDDTAQRLVHEGALPHPPSFFETLTALAFLYFAGTPVSEAVISTQDKPGKINQAVISIEYKPSRINQESVISTGGPQGRSGEPVLSVVEGTRFSSGAANPVDIAVLEVGMGGRLDATNIVEPLISIITDIALDHQDYLGHTIAEIAREKAGILRPRGTLVTLPQHPEANQTIGEVATALDVHAISAASFIPHTPVRIPNASPVITPNASPAQSTNASPVITTNASPAQSTNATPVILSEAQNLRISPDPPKSLPPNHYTVTEAGEPLEIDSPLSGQHQQRNIALAIAAAVELRNTHSYKLGQNEATRNHSSYKITNSAIETGIRNTRWPGRLELFTFPEGPSLLLDVAHNPAGAWTLRAAIAQLPEAQPRTLLFSCLRDKDLKEISQILFPLFDATSGDSERSQDNIVFAPIPNPRAASLEDLAAAARALDIPAQTAPDLAAALTHARAITPSDGIIIATGSIYLVGEVRQLLVLPHGEQE